ncbi:MAG: hypothetical protein QJR09_10745 [Micrococcus sp.]|nr:hypothetical protein [Micrococcus sp.]
MGSLDSWPSRVLAGTTAAVMLGAALAGPLAAAPPATASVPRAAPSAGAPHQTPAAIPVTGTIDVQVDLGSISATPAAGGTRCVLTADVTLQFSGTVEGTAVGETVARVNAPCSEVTTMPPGTFADTFRFSGDFEGDVAGTPTTAEVEYAGVTRAGGAVSAVLHLDGDSTVRATVRAQAGGSGTYRGIAVL